jgi:hypothetical protein
MKRHFAAAVLTLAAIIALPAVPAQAADLHQQKYPDVVNVKVQARGHNRFDFDVTVSSPYDTPQRYADAFRVMNADGMTYGVRELLHDHASEQPFTRELYGVQIPQGVRAVLVQARDKQHGYGGKSMQILLPGR